MSATALLAPVDIGATLAGMTQPQPLLPDEQALVAAMAYARPLACRLLRRADRESIDDVMQAAALKASHKAHQFAGRCSYNSWFARIVINTALMHLRDNHKHYTRLVSLECHLQRTPDQDQDWATTRLAEVLRDRRPSPLDLTTRELMLADLLAEIAELPPAMRKEMRRELAGDDVVGGNRARKSRKFHAVHRLRERLCGWVHLGCDKP